MEGAPAVRFETTVDDGQVLKEIWREGFNDRLRRNDDDSEGMWLRIADRFVKYALAAMELGRDGAMAQARPSKRCATCGNDRPLSEFPLTGDLSPSFECRDCKAVRDAARKAGRRAA